MQHHRSLLLLLAAGCSTSAPDDCDATFANDTDAVAARIGFQFSIPTDNPFAGDAAPTQPMCKSPKRTAEDAQNVMSARVVPIVFVPQGASMDDAALTKQGERIAQSLERVQAWYGAALGRTFNLDRLQVIDGRLPRDAYFCSGEAACSPAHLPERVAEELAARGMGPFSANRDQLVIVAGGGAVAAAWSRSDAGGSTAVIGDAALDALPAVCTDATCASAPVGADWIFARELGRMLGVRRSSIVGDTGLDAIVDAAATPDLVGDDLEKSAFSYGGGLRSGRLDLAVSAPGQTYNEYVEDLAFAPSSLVAIYDKPSYRTTGHNAKCPADGSFFSDILYDSDRLDCTSGWANTRLVAKLVTLAANGQSPELELDPAAPAPTDLARRVDSGASVAYDSARQVFQIVWYRRYQAAPNQLVQRIMGRTINAVDGTLGPLQVLRDLGPAEVSFHDVGRTDIKYNAAANNFVVIFGGTSRSFDQGSPLAAYQLANGALSGPSLLSTNADRAQMGFDPTTGRYLVTYTQSSGPSHDLFARLLGGNAAPIGAPIQIVPHDFSWGPHDAEPAFDLAHHTWLVAFDAPWKIYAQLLTADGNPLGQPQLVAGGADDRHQYDPGIAYVPATGRFATSFGDTDGWFFDGKGYSNAQYVTSTGRPFGSRLFLHRAYEALSQTEVAAHPSQNLAAVLRSGVGGVYVDLLQQDVVHYHEGNVGAPGGSVTVPASDPVLVGTSVAVPAGAVPNPVTIYVTIGDDIQPKAGQCTPKGPSVVVGSVDATPLQKAITVTIPFTELGYNPNDPGSRLSHHVMCRDAQTGSTFTEFATFTATTATFRLERFATCQFIFCGNVLTTYNTVSALANVNVPHDQELQQSCQQLEANHFLGAFDDQPASTRTDLRTLQYVNTMEGAILPWAPIGTSGALHRVWNLWDHEFAAFTSGNGPTVQFPLTVASVGYYSGYAAGIPAGGLPPTPGVARSFLHRTQMTATLTFPVDFIVGLGGRAFMMSGTPLVTGAELGLEVGVGWPELGDDMLLGGATFANSGAWEFADAFTSAVTAYDKAILGVFGFDTSKVSMGGSVELFGDTTVDPQIRAKMVATSILAETGGIDPVADSAAIIAVALANIAKENPSYTYKQDIDETCYCRLHTCQFRVGHIPNGTNQQPRDWRDARIKPGEEKHFYGDGLSCIFDGTHLTARAFFGVVGGDGPTVTSGCSSRQGGFAAGPADGIACCFR